MLRLFSIDDLPAAARELLARARSEGTTIWVVGGAVRDAKQGATLEDIDLSSALSPRQVVGMLLDAASAEVDERLGVCVFRSEGHEIVHTTFRAEGEYGADRRPRDLRFVATAEQDSVRRDFTVNAVYFDPLGGVLLDPHRGLADLAALRLRAIGDPRIRFAEDPLRILRAVRFEARAALRPTPATVAAMAELSPRIAALVPQRRFLEIDSLLCCSDPVPGLLRLLDLGALAAIAPDLGARSHELRSSIPAFAATSADPARARAERWRLLCGGADAADAVLRALEAPRALRRSVVDPD